MVRWKMPEFDAILFDFDGVLLDSEPVHCACWAEVLAPLGVTVEWEYYRQHGVGVDDRGMLRTMPPAPIRRATLKSFGRSIRRRRNCSRRAWRSCRRSIRRWTGSRRVARHVQAGGGDFERDHGDRAILAAGGIRQHFDTLVAAKT